MNVLYQDGYSPKMDVFRALWTAPRVGNKVWMVCRGGGGGRETQPHRAVRDGWQGSNHTDCGKGVHGVGSHTRSTTPLPTSEDPQRPRLHPRLPGPHPRPGVPPRGRRPRRGRAACPPRAWEVGTRAARGGGGPRVPAPPQSARARHSEGDAGEGDGRALARHGWGRLGLFHVSGWSKALPPLHILVYHLYVP
jgi:hypothetical protein